MSEVKTENIIYNYVLENFT